MNNPQFDRDRGRDRKVAAIVLAVAVVVSIFFYFTGRHHGYLDTTKAAQADASLLSAQHQKIMDVIVKKNPGATIRDFAGFPEFLIEQSAKRGLDYRYVMAIIETESEWNPRAVSHAGAIGLMQVMPATGALVAKNLGNPFEMPKGKDSLGTLGNPRDNLVIGLTHLKGLIDSYGLGPTHLRAYNRGDVAARAHWPADRYAEEVALKFVRLSMLVPQ